LASSNVWQKAHKAKKKDLYGDSLAASRGDEAQDDDGVQAANDRGAYHRVEVYDAVSREAGFGGSLPAIDPCRPGREGSGGKGRCRKRGESPEQSFTKFDRHGTTVLPQGFSLKGTG